MSTYYSSGISPDHHGLLPVEVLMLSYAHQYTESTTEYQGFWDYAYGISDPNAMLRSLADRGFLRLGGVPEAMEVETAVSLKEVLREYGLKVSGRKAELIERLLENISIGELEERFPLKYYARTDQAELVLSEKPYIGYVHSSGPMGIDEMELLVRKAPEKPWRDLIWGYFNQDLLIHAKAGNWGLYRNTKANMASFLAEELKWRDAILMLSEVIFWDLSGVGNGFSKEYLDLYMEYLFPYEKSLAIISPGILERLFDWANEGEVGDSELKELLESRIRRLKAPMRLFTTDEMLEIVFLERTADTAALSEIYAAAERRMK